MLFYFSVEEIISCKVKKENNQLFIEKEMNPERKGQIQRREKRGKREDTITITNINQYTKQTRLFKIKKERRKKKTIIETEI